MLDLVRQTQKVIMITLPGRPGDNIYECAINGIHHSTIASAELLVVSWHTSPDTFYVLKHRHRTVSRDIGWNRADMNLMLREYYEKEVETDIKIRAVLTTSMINEPPSTPWR